MTNHEIARTFERIADLLDQQQAPPERARAWREAAQSLRTYPRAATEVLHEGGRAALDEIPRIEPNIARVIGELIKTGMCGVLERLHGDPAHGVVASPPRDPSVRTLLAIDREYRTAAAAGELPRIAPRRYNPTGEAWLPILHVDRDGFSFTAMFSNAELAHRLERTADWVVIYYDEPHRAEGRATVVTEHQGSARGLRVVRGRERECAALVDVEPDASRQAG